jgi:DNA-binding response OmpR family regulator
VRILLIEDNQLVAENVVEFLERRSHEVDLAVDGRTGLKMACAERYDALIVDVQLPRLTGLELCRRFRVERGTRTPVLILTARDTLEDKLEGFEAGADDYLVKPLELRELLVRLESLHRRAEGSASDGGSLSYGDLELDLAKWEVRFRGDVVKLSRIGTRILELLLRGAPNIVRRETIREQVWGKHPPSDGVLRTHVYAVRKALGSAGAEELLHTVHGVGYHLRVRESDGS